MHDIDCVISMVLSNNGSLKIAKTLSSNCLKDHKIKFKKPKESAVGYSLVIFLKQSKSLRSVCFYQISSEKYIFKLKFPIKQETIHQARKVAVGMLLQSSSGFGPDSL